MSVFPGGASFIPDHRASGQLVVEFTRNPAAFALNRYAQMVPVPNTLGYFLRLDTAEAYRVETLDRFVWPDGNDAPVGPAEQHTWVAFACERRAFAFRLGHRGVLQATWDQVAAHARIKAQQAMTARCFNAATVLTTSANWSGNVATATAIAGGVWAGSSTANGYIKETCNAVAQRILASTGGVVTPDDMMLVVDPTGARIISESPEWQQYLVNHPLAVAAAQYDPVFTMFGLLPKVFGFRCIVDVTQRNSAREGATASVGGLFSGIGGGLNACAVFVSRPGGLTAQAAGAPTFSTVSVFEYENLTVETFADPKNRRTEGRVVDDVDVKLTAPASGYLVTNIDS